MNVPQGYIISKGVVPGPGVFIIIYRLQIVRAAGLSRFNVANSIVSKIINVIIYTETGFGREVI